jgi:hypothetical protein
MTWNREWPVWREISRPKRKFHLVFLQRRSSLKSSMKPLAAIGALCFLATTCVASAQIAVSAQTERTDYLLYERVDLLITVTNQSENDITLDNSEGHPWLSFLVSHHNRLPVRPERQGTFKGVALKTGESKTLRVNLTPLFSFREEGDYRAAAVIDLPGQGQIISDSVPFTVEQGKTVWTETRPVDGSQRIYSLIRFYTNLSLGEVVAYIDPEVFFDPQGNLHVMQPIAMATYLYSRADASGKILHQGVFKATNVPGIQGTVPPRLTKLEDGNVIVVGGLEQDSSTQRELLSQGQSKMGEQVGKKLEGPDLAPDAR